MHTHLPFRSTMLAAMTAAAFVGMPLAGCAEKDKEEVAREQGDQADRQEIRGTIVRIDTRKRVVNIEMDAADGKRSGASHSNDIRLDSQATVTIDGQRRDFADLKAGDRVIAFTAEPLPDPAARREGRAQALTVTEIRVFRDEQAAGGTQRDENGRMARDGHDGQGDRLDQQRRYRDTPESRNPARDEQELEWKKRTHTPKTPVGD